MEGKSPNHHNRFYIEFEPLEPGVIEALREGKISMKMEEVERRKVLIEKGMEKEEAKSIVGYYGTNVLLNMTKGIQYLRETMELILEGFEVALKNPGEYVKDYPAGDPLELRVGDFIAGMTDHYALDLYQKLFLPLAWTV